MTGGADRRARGRRSGCRAACRARTGRLVSAEGLVDRRRRSGSLGSHRRRGVTTFALPRRDVRSTAITHDRARRSPTDAVSSVVSIAVATVGPAARSITHDADPTMARGRTRAPIRQRRSRRDPGDDQRRQQTATPPRRRRHPTRSSGASLRARAGRPAAALGERRARAASTGGDRAGRPARSRTAIERAQPHRRSHCVASVRSDAR